MGRAAAFVRWSRSWLFTTNHKRIGVLYLWVTLLWFLMAGVDGLGVRAELATPSLDVWKPDFYNGLFTFHGTQMLFLFAIPVFSAFGNFFVPTMVGAKDMAFPRLNSLSLWLVFLSGVVLRVPLFVRQWATAGWTNYVPISGPGSSPDLGEDWWMWTVLLETLASTVGGINFLATIIRARDPSVKPARWPVFVWSMFATSLLAVLAGPFILTDVGLLYFDRWWGTHFFDPTLPGGTLLWQHLFWFYSHPATYIMVLPAFGIVSMVIADFIGKGLFSYKATVMSILGTTLISMLVFWHHMFTTGMQVEYSVFASVMTMAVSVPTAVLFFNWIASLRGGRIRFTTPMLFALGFIVLFGLGGIDGVFLASIPLDDQLHQTYWLIGHIHLVLFGGTVMGAFAGVYYWFPRMFGRRLGRGLGVAHFWGCFLGALLCFVPMHFVGVEGGVRRVWTYAPELWTWNLVESIGAAVMGLAMLVFLVNLGITLFRAPRAGDSSWWSEDELPAPSPRRPRAPALPGGGRE
jgi:cytochrome c oxidase subunit 1